MKPYTIIYEDRWQTGSVWYSNIKTARVVCEDISHVMKSDLGEKIRYIFEGHPKHCGENGDYKYDILYFKPDCSYESSSEW